MSPVQIAAATVETSVSRRQSLTIKRCHGLGNVVCLLPVLARLRDQGHTIRMVIRPEWLHTFSVLMPEILWTDRTQDDAVDLDELTSSLQPTEHRTDELGRLLGLSPPFRSPHLVVPEAWTEPFDSLAGSIVFAPEGGHPSRTWPTEKAAMLREYLQNEKLVLIGIDPQPEIPCDQDLRGQLELHELLGVLTVADTVVTMDSGVLHLAAALGTPAVAIFGGVDPDFRVRQDQRVVAMQTSLDCCPCNKNEICSGRFPCVRSAEPGDVIYAIQMARKTEKRLLYAVPAKKRPKRTYLTRSSMVINQRSRAMA
jgi:hypothetical protein